MPFEPSLLPTAHNVQGLSVLNFTLVFMGSLMNERREKHIYVLNH